MVVDINKKKEPEIRVNYNPSDEEKETIRFVYGRKEEMATSEMRLKAEKTWDKSDYQWEATRSEREKDDWQSNHYVPLTQAVIETALSEFVGQMPRPYLVPRGQEDIPKVTVMQKIYDYTWEIGDGDINEFDVLSDGLRRGTAIAQEYYWQERRIIQEVVMKDKKEELTEKEVIDYDDCYMENVKLEDFYVDEFARGFDGSYAARDCIRRYIMNIDDFKIMFSGSLWNPLDNTKYVKAGGDVNYFEYYKPPTGIDTSKQVEVLWYWAVKPKDWLIIVANDVLIKKVPIPFKHKKLPFVRTVAVKRTHSFYGKGLAEILESVQDETNVLRRMIIDRNHLDIDKMFFVSNRLGLSDEDLIARPHGMIPTDDVTGAKAIEYGDIPRSVELSLKHLEDDATISTGINPRAQALPTVGTATEATMLKDATLKRLQKIMWLHKYSFLIPLARLRVSNILQFYTQPKLEKIVGEKGTEEYKAEVAKAQQTGSLQTIDGADYKTSYRNIRLENKAIDFNEKGQPKEVPAQGFTFFEAKPEYFVSKLGYDVKFGAGAFLQISKPLQQARDLELADRLLNIALTVPNSYDPVKIGDMVVKAYDKNPDTLKPDQTIQSDQDARLQLLVQLAGMENQQMLKGQAVPATQFANPAHTRMHIEFFQSDKVPADQTIAQIFTDHIVGEIATQEGRAGNLLPNQNGQPGATPPPQPGGQTTRTSISQGITNKRGGMKQPKTKLEQIMPSLNSGGNKGI